MTSPSDFAAQLVVEVIVRDLERSIDFYQALGFEVARRTPDFASLRWHGHSLFLAEDEGRAPSAGPAAANVRVLVPDVDVLWERVLALGTRVESPIADRTYGLRDFTILDPDGFGIRFASPLPGVV